MRVDAETMDRHYVEKESKLKVSIVLISSEIVEPTEDEEEKL